MAPELRNSAKRVQDFLYTILDQDLKKYEVIWAAAGTPFAVFKLKPADLEPLTKGIWVDLSEEI